MERHVAVGQLPAEEIVERGDVRKKLIIEGVVINEAHEEDGGSLMGDGEVHEERGRLTGDRRSRPPAWEVLLEEEAFAATRPLKRIGQDEVFCWKEGAEGVGDCK